MITVTLSGIGPEQEEVLIEASLGSAAAIRQRKSTRLLFLTGGIILMICGFIANVFLFEAIGAAAILIGSFGMEALQKTGFRQALKKMDPQLLTSDRTYTFSEDGIDISSVYGSGHSLWTACDAWGEKSPYIWIRRADNQTILADCSKLTEAEKQELVGYLKTYIKN